MRKKLMKWYELKQGIDELAYDKKCKVRRYFIETGDRYCYYYEDDKNEKLNIKIDLFKVATKELQDVIIKRVNWRNKMLSDGICRESEDEYCWNFPDYLKRIVYTYFNALLD